MDVLQRSSTKAEPETPPGSGVHFKEQLVIKEARRRQRRRWLGLGITALVIVGAGLLLTIPGGHSPSKARPTTQLPSPLPPVPATTVNTLPGGQQLPPGAQITSVVRYQSKEVAAGVDFPGGSAPALPACAERGCSPIVWTSADGTRWSATWGTAANGSIPGEQLVVGPNILLLFDADESTSLWDSTDAVTWNRVALPGTMAGLVVRDAVFAHGRFVAILNNKFAGGPVTAYGESDAVWSSGDGTTWQLGSVPGPPAAFQSLTVVPTGFRIVGVLRPGGTSAAWTSPDGVTWSMTG